MICTNFESTISVKFDDIIPVITETHKIKLLAQTHTATKNLSEVRKAVVHTYLNSYILSLGLICA